MPPTRNQSANKSLRVGEEDTGISERKTTFVGGFGPIIRIALECVGISNFGYLSFPWTDFLWIHSLLWMYLDTVIGVSVFTLKTTVVLCHT